MEGFAEIYAELPRLFNPGDELPPDLVGSRILAFGKPAIPDLEGGGLAIRYERADGSVAEAIFEFTELGMWLNSHQWRAA